MPHMRENYEQLVNAIPDGVMVHRDSLLLYANSALLQMIGYESTEIVGQSVLLFLVAKQQELDERYAAFYSNNGKRLSSFKEYSLKRKDGAIIKIQTAGILVDWDEERAVLNFFRDVSYVAEMEKERQKFYLEIEKKNSALEQKNVDL